MPVDFLTSEQIRQYGRFHGDPSPAQLGKYFFLHDKDRQEVLAHRGAHNRLGYALQRCTVRFLGTFLADPLEVPRLVVHHLAQQLDIPDPSCVNRYVERRNTPLEHAQEIRRRHGYKEFSTQPGHWRLARWLYRRAWISAERPIVLFDLATARLAEKKILLPGASGQLEKLLAIPEDGRVSLLDELCQPAVNISAPGMVEALQRVIQFRQLGLATINLSRIPPGRLQVLAQYAAAARSQAIAKMQYCRRMAMLLAFAHVYEGRAQDDAVDLLHQLISTSVRRAEKRGEAKRLETIPELDAAALRLRDVARIVLDPLHADASVRAAIFKLIPRSQLQQAVDTITKLSRAEEEHRYYEHLLNSYTQVRRFLPTLLQTIQFAGGTAAQPALRALTFLQEVEG